jgi:hypothetical protein
LKKKKVKHNDQEIKKNPSDIFKMSDHSNNIVNKDSAHNIEADQNINKKNNSLLNSFTSYTERIKKNKNYNNSISHYND